MIRIIIGLLLLVIWLFCCVVYQNHVHFVAHLVGLVGVFALCHGLDAHREYVLSRKA
jgi:uncharacterized membrane protein